MGSNTGWQTDSSGGTKSVSGVFLMPESIAFFWCEVNITGAEGTGLKCF